MVANHSFHKKNNIVQSKWQNMLMNIMPTHPYSESASFLAEINLGQRATTAAF